MSLDTLISEARRQVEICNACRYCEGYCSVFPAIARQKAFSDGDITQLANLCHNCRGCYYACQYTEPHEFALNLPAALAEVRHDSWERHIHPQAFAKLFQSSGVAIAALMVVVLSWAFWAIAAWAPAEGEGFYAVLAHDTLVAIFMPAFLAPLVLIGLGLRNYWREVGGGHFRLSDMMSALASAGRMKNLSGGQDQGCNFEQADRYSDRRRQYHQAMMYGFLLCFAATSVGTVMHYGLGWKAPYPLFSLPKLLGLTGGVLMLIGGTGLAWLKTKADPALGSAKAWSGEMAFILLLVLVAASGLLLYMLGGTPAMPAVFALHMASILVLFFLMPFSKMVHGFFRLTALVVEAGKANQTKDF